MLVGITACGKDDPVGSDQVDPYQDLSQRDHTLVNLELANNHRNLAEIDRLFASDFQFLFSPIDYSLGITPQNWDRIQEMAATTNMFNPVFTGYDPLSSIVLEINISAEGWSEVTTSAGGSSAAGAVYSATFTYSFSATIGSDQVLTLVSIDRPARLTVRQTDIGGKQVWLITKWEDDIQSGGSRIAVDDFSLETTWGELKYLYSD